MDIERMQGLLPEKPCNGLYERFLGRGRHAESKLGGEFLIFHRESITIEPELQACMSPEDWAVHSKETKRKWGAICFCTACEEEFIAGFVSDPILRGIALGQGADGQLYDGYPYDAYGNTAWDCVIEIPEGEHIQCPLCDSYVQVLRRSDLRQGRTYQLAVASVEVIEQYAALVTWFVRRRIDEDGFWEEDIRPRDALVIDENGRLQHFIHTKGGGFIGEGDLAEWRYSQSFGDAFQRRYYNFDSINHRLVGGKCYTNMPWLAGTTGEKSGLAEYMQEGGGWPHMYLKLWRAHPNVENLIKAGWIGLIEKNIDRKLNQSFEYYGAKNTTTPVIPGVDLKEKKPHKMLGITKAESKTLQAALSDPDAFGEWIAWRDGPQQITATEFAELKKMFGGVSVLAELRGLYHDHGEEWELRAVLRYVRQHKEMKPQNVVQTLLDYRNMYREQHPRRRKFTPAELWPVALRREHDVLAERALIRKSEKEREKLLKGFAEVLQKYGDLEWTDGDLCIRLPRNNGELYTEGTVLRHCVKRYGNAHVKGEDTIFFVRHYRRPERSYYTLDICMTADMPYEKQLHGYGNEHHGKHLEDSHTIPEKVRAFVDRWKVEVLAPWVARQKAAQKKSEKAKERKTA